MTRPAIHGGAGVMRAMPPRKQGAYVAGLTRTLDAGNRILEAGGASLDAATAAVVALEDVAHGQALDVARGIEWRPV